MKTIRMRRAGAVIGTTAVIAIAVIGAGACDKSGTADPGKPLTDPTTTSWISEITSSIESYITTTLTSIQTTIKTKLELPTTGGGGAVRG